MSKAARLARLVSRVLDSTRIVNRSEIDWRFGRFAHIRLIFGCDYRVVRSVQHVNLVKWRKPYLIFFFRRGTQSPANRCTIQALDVDLPKHTSSL